MSEAASTYTPDHEEPVFVGKAGGANIARLDLVRDYIRHEQNSGREFFLVASAFKLGPENDKRGVTDALVSAFNQCLESGYQESFFDDTKDIHRIIIEEYLDEENQTAAWEHYGLEIDKIRRAFEVFRDQGMSEAQLRDYVTGAGERMSSGIVEVYLKQEGIESQYVGDVEATNHDDRHEGMKEGLKRVLSETRQDVVKIIGGHIQTEQGAPRGYSDYTGVLTAAVVADLRQLASVQLHLLKNVDGICTTNPNDLPEKEKDDVRPVPQLSLTEALQLAAASDDGMEVIQLAALKAAAKETRVALHLCNIEKPGGDGTLISRDPEVSGKPFEIIASQEKVQAVVIEGADMIGEAGFASIATEMFDSQGLSYDLNVETGTMLCYTFKMPRDADKVRQQNEKIQSTMKLIREKMHIRGKNTEVHLAENLATVSLVGRGINGALSGIIESILLYEDIEIKGTSQVKRGGVLPFIIDEKDRERAVAAIHRYCFGNDNKAYREQVAHHREQRIQQILGQFEPA